ncbi:MAG: glycosyltransferase family 2 protein [Chloroflexota bacterium]|nr:glycosyltransferase family 2 protein [Chloroflexota bacterium]
MSNQLTAIILTKNEETNVSDCIESLRWADAIVVFDSHSDDRTAEIARGKGARVIQHSFRGYGSQRNAALDAVDAAWVFFVDADERATPQLSTEIRRVIEDETNDGWWVPRHNHIFGKVVLHTGWYPDYQLRLLRRQRARYDPQREVHEVVILDGEAGYLKYPLIHYNYATVGQFLEKQRRYANYDASILWEQGIRARPHKFVTRPLDEFRRRYFALQGYKDGWRGLLLSGLMAYYQLVVYGRLRRLDRN